MTDTKIEMCNFIGHQPIKRKLRSSVAYPGEVELQCQNCRQIYSPLIKDKFDTCPKCSGKVKQRMESYQYCGTCGTTGPFRR